MSGRARYHYSTWGNGRHMGRLVEDSLELCEDSDCTDRHVCVSPEDDPHSDLMEMD